MEKWIRRFASPIVVDTLADVEQLFTTEDNTMLELRSGDTVVYTDKLGMRQETNFEEVTRDEANARVDQQVRHMLLYSKEHKNKSYVEVYHEYLDRHPIMKAKITGVPVLVEVENG